MLCAAVRRRGQVCEGPRRNAGVQRQSADLPNDSFEPNADIVKPVKFRSEPLSTGFEAVLNDPDSAPRDQGA